jgi:hypothetical protein
MLQLTPLKSRQKNLRPVAVVKQDDIPIGWLKVGENGGEELIELPPNLKFSISPETRENHVDNIFITGPAGCGKSSFVGDYCKNFIEMFNPDPQFITVISADDFEDPAYKFPHRHIKVDDEFGADPPTLDEFTSPDKRSIVVFDDVEGISDKKRLRAVEGVIESCLTMGRKRGINTLFISHRAANAKQTRMILTELNMCVWFPQVGSSRNLSYMLKNYLNISEGLRDALKSPGWGRWVALKNNVPNMLISEKRATMYDADEVEKVIKKRTIIDKKRNQREAEEMLDDNL